ncbi:hypothetical protein KSX_58640 [Ktedonospora formicarum]|uniref:Uncharacterized protein n=1 Tax=Ktedonospora formicarum TaxID=2778364 RepID=A0A8J3I5A9_9CHLR|nr:hypothetical protein KSX_58640 [Ktedonospora formicarum]
MAYRKISKLAEESGNSVARGMASVSPKDETTKQQIDVGTRNHTIYTASDVPLDTLERDIKSVHQISWHTVCLLRYIVLIIFL